MNHFEISKFISKINIARQGHFKVIKVQHSKIVLKLLEFFEEMGIIRGFYIIPDEAQIKVFLKYKVAYVGGIIRIKHVSKPSKRVYFDMMKLIKTKEKFSKCFYIIVTKKGLMTDAECLRQKIGGEVLLKIIL
jgi:ribosomal protein S8